MHEKWTKINKAIYVIIISIMTVLAAHFRLLPIFKPTTAIIIITGIYVGPFAGFTTGAMAAVISNFYFGQGPWTIFQMIAWGVIGLFAGCLREPLKKSKIALIIYSIFTGLLFSFVMDIWTVLWYSKGFKIDLYFAALITALPYTIIYIVSNVIFICLMIKPFGRKLSRVMTKYGYCKNA